MISTIAAGCQPAGKVDMDWTKTLAAAAERTAPGQVLSLDEILPFAWDQVMLVGPYTPTEAIQQATGGMLSGAMKSIEIDRRDDVNMLVFMQDGKANMAAELPRRVADFDKADLLRPVARTKARLVRAAAGVGFRWQTP